MDARNHGVFGQHELGTCGSSNRHGLRIAKPQPAVVARSINDLQHHTHANSSIIEKMLMAGTGRVKRLSNRPVERTSAAGADVAVNTTAQGDRVAGPSHIAKMPQYFPMVRGMRTEESRCRPFAPNHYRQWNETSPPTHMFSPIQELRVVRARPGPWRIRTDRRTSKRGNRAAGQNRTGHEPRTVGRRERPSTARPPHFVKRRTHAASTRVSRPRVHRPGRFGRESAFGRLGHDLRQLAIARQLIGR